MTPLASREMTEQEMINTSTAPQMAHLIQVLRQTIRNKDEEIERWVDMVKQLQRDDELDPPEPKPLLADAKVGDLCQRMDGKWVQVDSYSNDRPCPVMCKSDIGGQDCFTLDGRNHNAINDSKDIIHTEPLAEVGSAEWAWQMLKIGRMVTDAPTLHHYEHNIKTSMVTCVTNRRGFRHSARSIDTWGEGRRETGWQLYEEPQPTYKVGDWVEYKKGKHHQVDSVHDGCCYLSYGKGCGCFSALYSDITRKLDPSEVVIRIGCLSGTVTYAISDDCFLLAKVNDPQHRACCIDMSMLDTPTREMVESLLRAQEEK